MRHDIQEYPRSAISLNCTTGLRSFHLEVACHSPAHIAAILSKLPGCLSEPRQTIDFNLIQNRSDPERKQEPWVIIGSYWFTNLPKAWWVTFPWWSRPPSSPSADYGGLKFMSRDDPHLGLSEAGVSQESPATLFWSNPRSNLGDVSH